MPRSSETYSGDGDGVVLVTGAAGFIGSAVTRRLVGRGQRVVGVDALTYAASSDTLRDLDGRSEFRLCRLDIRDAEAMRAVVAEVAPRAVLHLAAESHVDRSIDGPGVFIDTNVRGTFNLLQAARAFWSELPADRAEAFRFHHVSTDEVYGSLGAEGFFDETSRYDPSSPYAASKAAADHLVASWHRTYGLPTLISNCCNNYGPYQFPEKLIPQMILRALEGRPLPLYGDGRNVRDWIHVDDHADALIAVLERGRPSETYAVGARAERTNIEVVRTICEALDERAPRDDGKSHANTITFVPDRPGHDRRYAIDPSKVEDELGWRPSMTFDTGVRETVAWYVDNRWWWEPLRKGRYDGSRIGLGRSSVERP